jgi:hypothetical protein
MSDAHTCSTSYMNMVLAMILLVHVNFVEIIGEVVHRAYISIQAMVEQVGSSGM